MPTTVSRRRISPVTLVLGVLLVVAVVVIVVLAQNRSRSGTVGSGVATQETRVVPRFDGVELAGSNNVAIHVGPAPSVVVHADDNLVRFVTTRVVDGRLVVGTRPGSFRTHVPTWVEVAVPALSSLTLSGSGTMAADGIAGDELDVLLSGSGALRASGAIQRLSAKVTGSGAAQLAGLTARDAQAVVSGSGPIFLTATRRLVATVSGSGAILYGGNPVVVRPTVTGSGAITPTGR